MDPDVALAQLLDALSRLEAYRDGQFPRPDIDTAIDDAVEAGEALQEWRRTGGFLPKFPV